MRSNASLVQLHRQLRESGFQAALPKVAYVWQDSTAKHASEVTPLDVSLIRHRQTP